MNKKIFLMPLLALTLIPTVFALTPSEFLEAFIGFIERLGSSGVGEAVAYLRIVFGFIIGGALYSLFSKFNLSKNLSLFFSTLMALSAVLFAPQRLLLTVATSYNVILWTFLLSLPILITFAVSYVIPDSSNWWRSLKILLFGVMIYATTFAKEGLTNLANNANAPSILETISDFILWIYIAIVIAIGYQAVKIFLSFRGSRIKSSTSTQSTPSTPTSSMPHQPRTINLTGIPASALPSFEERKEKKKGRKSKKQKLLKKLKQQQKQIQDLNRQVATLQGQPLTHETQQDLQDGKTIYKKLKQETHNDLEQMFGILEDQEREVTAEMNFFKRNTLELLQAKNQQPPNSVLRRRLEENAHEMRSLYDEKQKELRQIQGAKARVIEKAQKSQQQAEISIDDIEAAEEALEREEERVEDLEQNMEEQLRQEDERRRQRESELARLKEPIQQELQRYIDYSDGLQERLQSDSESDYAGINQGKLQELDRLIDATNALLQSNDMADIQRAEGNINGQSGIVELAREIEHEIRNPQQPQQEEEPQEEREEQGRTPFWQFWKRKPKTEIQIKIKELRDDIKALGSILKIHAKELSKLGVQYERTPEHQKTLSYLSTARQYLATAELKLKKDSKEDENTRFETALNHYEEANNLTHAIDEYIDNRGA